jgi:hypothetical protein
MREGEILDKLSDLLALQEGKSFSELVLFLQFYLNVGSASVV